MKQKIEDALALATKAHEGQTDRAGNAYIQHPITVASFVETEKEKILALLHDTVEDTDVTNEQVREQFGDEIADALALLTHDKSEPYMDYIEKLSKNPLATAVKLADLKHNMDMSRLPEVTEKDIERQKKYEKAKQLLLEARLQQKNPPCP